MLQVGILSDTHGSIHPRLYEFFESCDELWHAGDIGDISVTDRLREFKPLVAVYGNIDGALLRSEFPKEVLFQREQIQVFMTHIGGYPGKYQPGIRQRLMELRPKLFVCGHSHILKIIFDQNLQLLHINPGASGNSGLHHKITMIRMKISEDRMFDVEILEIDR
jgi:putative phosphoesterase